MTKMRIAVIGADGFVGRAVVRALASADWAIPVELARGARPVASTRFERRRVDATDPRALATALADLDAAINCVMGDRETIVASGRALVDGTERSPKFRIVHLSSMAVYGPAIGEIDEGAALIGEGDYAVAKIEVERMVASSARTTVLRPGIIYGPGGMQWSERIARWLLTRRIGNLGAAGNGYCNLVHVDDVAQATLLALRNPATGGHAFNLSMQVPPTWNEYFRLFSSRLGIADPTRVSARRLDVETRLVAFPLKLVDKVTTRLGVPAGRIPQPITSDLLALWRQPIRLSMQKTIRDLGYRGRPLDDGLAETAAQYKKTTAA